MAAAGVSPVTIESPNLIQKSALGGWVGGTGVLSVFDLSVIKKPKLVQSYVSCCSEHVWTYAS